MTSNTFLINGKKTPSNENPSSRIISWSRRAIPIESSASPCNCTLIVMTAAESNSFKLPSANEFVAYSSPKDIHCIPRSAERTNPVNRSSCSVCYKHVNGDHSNQQMRGNEQHGPAIPTETLLAMGILGMDDDTRRGALYHFFRQQLWIVWQSIGEWLPLSKLSCSKSGM